MSGKDFRFGEGAKGKSSTLKSFAEDEENGVWYMSIKDFMIDDEKVSTSHIKELLNEGNVKKAGELLGRHYAICGTVIHGADRGAKVVGFPTIAYPENKHEVKEGVYTVKCSIGENVYYGIANYGGRPTFDEALPVFEVYLDGFEGTNYDEIITVEFIDYIRDIQKFDSAESLNAQLTEDILHAKREAELAATEATESAPAPAAPTPAPVVAPVAESAPVAEEQSEVEPTPEEEKQTETEVAPVVEEHSGVEDQEESATSDEVVSD